MLRLSYSAIVRGVIIHLFLMLCLLSPLGGLCDAPKKTTEPAESFKAAGQGPSDRILYSTSQPLDLDFVKGARIVYSRLFSFVHKTLIIEFKQDMTVLSTLEGWRSGIKIVGNGYSPPQVWKLYHSMGLETSRKKLYHLLKLNPEYTSLLFTGADMDHLSVKEQRFRDMRVYALVTAGVRGNAMKMARDSGNYYEPGTINIIVLTNMKLTPRALTRAIITATEAKSAALSDLDIRSSFSGSVNQATGTGTDNIIVVHGTGTPIHKTGGHTKMGELIAMAVYDGVTDAIAGQNRIKKGRSVPERLVERKIPLQDYITQMACETGFEENVIRYHMETVLNDPVCAGFLETAFAVSDAFEKGLIRDLTFFRRMCNQFRYDNSKEAVKSVSVCNKISDDVPPVLKMALEAFSARVNGQIRRQLLDNEPDMLRHSQ